MDIDRLTINRVLSHLISTELEHMWLIDFKCTSLNFSVIFQLHNYWFFAIFRTQCRTSNIEPNTEGISELFASNKPIFCCTQECSGWCMWLNSSYITHWMFFLSSPRVWDGEISSLTLVATAKTHCRHIHESLSASGSMVGVWHSGW